jgi:hypothetical protein
MAEFDEFIKEELEGLDKAREEALKQKGFQPFFKFPQGETVVEFKKQTPRPNPRFPQNKVFRIVVDGEEYDLSVNSRSPLYRDILNVLSQGVTKVKVIRVGQGRDTRYTVMKI